MKKEDRSLSYLYASPVNHAKQSDEKIENGKSGIESIFHQTKNMKPYNHYKPISKILPI